MRIVKALTLAVLAAGLGQPALAQKSDKNSAPPAEESSAPATEDASPGDDAAVAADESADEHWPTMEEVKAYFLVAYAKPCEWVLQSDMFSGDPEHWELPFRYESDEAGMPDRKFDLYQFACTAGAYNFGQVFIGVDEYYGMRPIAFSEPDLDIEWSDFPDSTTVTKMEIDGFTATDILVNSEFDEETRTIMDFSKWRGIGDASSSGTWVFKEGQFVLKRYEVDASYDGEGNPVTVVNYTDQP